MAYKKLDEKQRYKHMNSFELYFGIFTGVLSCLAILMAIAIIMMLLGKIKTRG